MILDVAAYVGIPAFVSKPLSYLATAALGWFGRIWKDHSKRRRMRKHLYLELARNYIIFCEVMMNPDSLSQYPEWRDYPVQTKYYEYALKDMDTFHSLHDYGYLSSIFDEIALTRGLRGQTLSYRIWNIKEGITSGILAGTFDKTLLLSEASDEQKEFVEREVKRVETQRRQADLIRREASLAE